MLFDEAENVRGGHTVHGDVAFAAASGLADAFHEPIGDPGAEAAGMDGLEEGDTAWLEGFHECGDVEELVLGRNVLQGDEGEDEIEMALGKKV